MNEKFKLLDFDSELFGYQVALINKKENIQKDVIQFLRRKGYQIVYIVSDSEVDISQALLGFNISYKSAKVTYIKDTENHSYNFNNTIIPFSEQHSYEEIEKLALQSGIHSRFLCDERFENNEFEKLYKIWIERSVKMEIADYVYVSLTNGGRISGFITAAQNERKLVIGLVSVSEESRGKRIGSDLLEKVNEIALKSGMETIEVATQYENKMACRFYEKNGFKIKKIENIYHLWLR